LATRQLVVDRDPAVALLRDLRPGRAAEPRHVARHGAFDRSAVVRLDVDGTEGRTLSTRSEPRLQRVEVRNERQFLGREPPPLVQSPRRSVPRQHLEPDYLGTAFAQTRDSVADERRRDAFPTRARPHVQVVQERGARVLQLGERVTDRFAVDLGDERDSVADDLPAPTHLLLEVEIDVVRFGDLTLELAPELLTTRH